MNLRDLALKFSNLSPSTKVWIERALWIILGVLACYLLREHYPRVETVEHVVEDTKKLDEAKETIRTLTSQVTHWQTVASRKTTTKTTPVLLACDGGTPLIATTTVTTTDENTAGSGGSTLKGDTTANKDTLSTEEAHRETTKTVKVVPDWRVSVYVGVQSSAPLIPISGGLTLGVGLERHIAGPVSAGVVAHTGGGIMGGVSGSF